MRLNIRACLLENHANMNNAKKASVSNDWSTGW